MLVLDKGPEDGLDDICWLQMLNTHIQLVTGL